MRIVTILKLLMTYIYNIVTTLSTASVKTFKHSKYGRGCCLAGWNTYVAEDQRVARLHFRLWELAGRHGCVLAVFSAEEVKRVIELSICILMQRGKWPGHDVGGSRHQSCSSYI